MKRIMSMAIAGVFLATFAFGQVEEDPVIDQDNSVVDTVPQKDSVIDSSSGMDFEKPEIEEEAPTPQIEEPKPEQDVSPMVDPAKEPEMEPEQEPEEGDNGLF